MPDPANPPPSREFHDVRGDRDVHSLGPFERYPVVVNGWTVDLLQACYGDDGRVWVSLPSCTIDLDQDDAGRIIGFIADAIAIASGWTCHPESPDWTPENDVGPMRRPPFHKMIGLDVAATETEEQP